MRKVNLSTKRFNEKSVSHLIYLRYESKSLQKVIIFRQRLSFHNTKKHIYQTFFQTSKEKLAYELQQKKKITLRQLILYK